MIGRDTQVSGATTIGVVFDIGVILASEKRVMYGNLIMSEQGRKVFKITESIGAACAGSFSDMQNLMRNLRSKAFIFELEARRPISVRSVSRLLSNMLSEQRGSVVAEVLIGGVDDQGAFLFFIDSLGSVISDKYFAVGSGASLALGVLERGFHEGIAFKEAKHLVLKSLKSAARRDVMSGTSIDMLIITKNGIQEESLDLDLYSRI